MNIDPNIDLFYSILYDIEKKFPKRYLSEIKKRDFLKQGVYFFFEPNEVRLNGDLRIVRVGSHAIDNGSNAILYDRLYFHKGYRNMVGRHRSSVFRELIGYALMNSEKLNYPFWGDRSKKKEKEIHLSEWELEKKVTEYLHTLPFIALEVNGPSFKTNDRAFIETNSIALLSNYHTVRDNTPSEKWLGHFTAQGKVIRSGLWNRDDVDYMPMSQELFSNMHKHLKDMKRY